MLFTKGISFPFNERRDTGGRRLSSVASESQWVLGVHTVLRANQWELTFCLVLSIQSEISATRLLCLAPASHRYLEWHILRS
jgi:hypothetical protein